MEIFARWFLSTTVIGLALHSVDVGLSANLVILSSYSMIFFVSHFVNWWLKKQSPRRDKEY